MLVKLKQRGYRDSTLRGIDKALRQISRECNLDNPEDVLNYVSVRRCSEARKEILCNAYQNYCRILGIFFDKPRYEKSNKIPFIPTESDVDSLIASVPLCMHACINMIQSLYGRTENSKVFQLRSDSLRSFTRIFERQRRHASLKLQNPKLLQISFKTLRHFKGTMEYYKTRDILHVKETLGHKAISNTLKYIHLVELLFDKSDEYTCRIAKSVDEAVKLVESGFDYVTEMDGLKLFKRRK